MKIVSIKLKNFRGYSKEIKVNFDKLTVFVGKNDIGKSTILEALDIFFNNGNGVVKIEKNDINVDEARNNNHETIISVCFDELPENVVIDSTYETNLKDEYLLNSEGYLEVIKKYKDGGTPKIYLRANQPINENCSKLIEKKNADLKKIVIKENIECENQSINALLRKAIFNRYKDESKFENIEIDTTKEDGKIIWENLSKYLPIYSLFQSDRKNSDSDNEVQDPLKLAVKQILLESDIEKELNSVAEKVNKKLQEVADRTLEKIKEMDIDVAKTLQPVIPTSNQLKWNDVFKNVSITGDDNIPINKRGSGVKRLVLLNFFRAEAERKLSINNNRGIIYAVEEPETSQHTTNQKLLIDAFKTLSEKDSTQVILTTHSSNVVKKLQFSDLRLIRKDENNIKSVEMVKKGQLNYPSLNEVNYVAFDEVTEEYHNELYGFIEYNNWLNEYKNNKEQIEYVKKAEKVKKINITITEYIRHQIHHPENKLNPRYTEGQLKESIEEMRDFINKKEIKNIKEVQNK